MAARWVRHWSVVTGTGADDFAVGLGEWVDGSWKGVMVWGRDATW